MTGLVSEEETRLCPAAAAAKSLQSCPTLCDPIDSSPTGSPVPVILQARILEWLPLPSPRDLPNPGIKPRSPNNKPIIDLVYWKEGQSNNAWFDPDTFSQ